MDPQVSEIESKTHPSKLVTFRLDGTHYGVPIERVAEMALLGELEPLAGSPPFLRGLMRLRGSVIPVVDLRIRLSMPSLEQERTELRGMLEERKKDHIHWLEELEIAVREGTRFTLATDPTRCAFGRWYGGFRTTDPVLARHLSKFDAPHRKIHSLARTCLGLAAEGHREEAQEIITESRHGVLVEMIDLFDAAGVLIAERSRQMVVMVHAGEQLAGLAVDEVESVLSYEAGETRPAPAPETCGCRLAALVTTREGLLIQVLDLDDLLTGAFLRPS